MPLPTASPTARPTAVPPSATAAPPALFDAQLGIDNPIARAEVPLTPEPGEACEQLAAWIATLSDADQHRLTDCPQALEPVVSDAQGRDCIPHLAPGWYSIGLIWILTDVPDQMGLMSMAIHDSFLTRLGESTASPGPHLGIATRNGDFYYSGGAEQAVSFDYNKNNSRPT